ncbi:nitrous oxide-stimulated promoter family protein [Poseidonibacter sp.]|uniref:nitrous oxide-stimulated promoter family protein n=1 Tax=Poseidonibacter sp. TaxID=2321188 RepID=UPI003C735359
MKNEKFKTELEILDKFISTFCSSKHSTQKDCTIDVVYKKEKYTIKTDLCSSCQEILNYSIQRLLVCPHEEKPRCRKCPNPCYEKQQWKNLAKIMRYSGFKLGFLRIKDLFN